MRQCRVVACGVSQRATVEGKTVCCNADAVGVGLRGKNRVSKHQCSRAGTRCVVGLHCRTTNVQCELRRTGHGRRFAHRDGDTHDITHIQRTVLNTARRTDRNTTNCRRSGID